MPISCVSSFRLLLREFSPAAIAAGLTAFIWYACGALPLQLAVLGALELPPALASAAVFVVWTSGAIASIVLSARLRQPIPITWSIPCLVYLGSLGGRFSVSEIAGAVLVSAFILGALVLAGAGARLMRWLPMPILMGMFAGSLLEYLQRAVLATLADAVVAGSIVAAYLGARMISHRALPPVGAALLAGCAGVALTGGLDLSSIEWGLPVVAMPHFSFDAAAIASISVPLVVLALGLGHVQGLGFLISQGYAVPVDRVSRAVALASLLNALFGAGPATVARNGAAILGGRDAGPQNARYWGVLVSSVLLICMAFAAVPFASLLSGLPRSFAIALAGVALLSALQDALEKAFTGALRFGALVAFIVAATPAAVLGAGALWALVAGIAASLLAERRALLALWRTQERGLLA